MQNRKTILFIDDQSTSINRISVDISQDLSIFFILYFFYNANILEKLEISKYKITAMSFVNDINILTYDTSTTSNCKALEQTHAMCEQWTSKHEARFASIKYELFHLARNHKRFDMSIIINIKKIIKKSSTTVRVLKMRIDIKLKWESHVRKFQKKMITQMLALTRLIVFTWEVCFKKTRHVYNVVVKSIITYDSSTWHALHERFDIMIALINKLIDLQKQELRIMNDVFRATLSQLLDVETQIQLIKLHLTYL